MSHEIPETVLDGADEWAELATAATGAEAEATYEDAGEQAAVETGRLALDGLRAVMGATRLETADQDKVMDWEEHMAEGGLSEREQRVITMMSLAQTE